MPIDANIALGIKPPQFEDINTIKARGLQLSALTRADQQAQQDQAEQTTIRDLYRRSTGADGKIDVNVLSRSLAEAGLGDKVPGIQKQALEARRAGLDADKTGTDSDAAKLKLTKDKIDGMNGILAGVLSNPNAGAEEVTAGINEAVNRGYLTAEQGAQTARTVGPNPRQWAMQRAVEGLDHAKQIDLLIPKYDEQDRGGTVNEGTINPLTGVRTAGTDTQKTQSPDSKAVSARVAAAGFGDAESNLLAALAEQGVSLPAGMRSKDQQVATLRSLLARNPGMTPDEIAYKVGTGQIGFGVDKKETTTAAAQSGKIRYAENEIKQIAPLIREASALVPRGNFVPWNKLSQIADTQISDPNLKQLKSYMNTLSNAYDMLAARGGTDMDKRAHNRAMFDSADSPEALEAALKAVEQEAEVSDRAALASTTRRDRPGAPSAAPTADVPADIAALLKKHGSK